MKILSFILIGFLLFALSLHFIRAEEEEKKGSSILYVTEIEGKGDIYSIKPDGTGGTKLTKSPSSDSRPQGAPGGDHIAFISSRGGNPDIYIMKTDKEPFRLTNNQVYDYSPSFCWSPCGTKLVYETDADGNPEIYIMKLVNSQKVRLTKNGVYDGHPAWSPDGNLIAFESWRQGNNEIYTMKLDGSGVKRLTKSEADDYYPSWSPDCKDLVFLTRNKQFASLQIVDKEGYYEPWLLDKLCDRDAVPQWSPDGKTILYVSWEEGDREIYTIKRDGRGIKNLSKNPAEDTTPVWSADGKKVIFASNRNRNWEIYIMNSDGTSVKNLTDNPYDDLYPFLWIKGEEKDNE